MFSPNRKSNGKMGSKDGRRRSETTDESFQFETCPGLRKPKNINSIQLGMFEIDTWYFSPYPEEYGKTQKTLFICEYCLKYLKVEKTYRYHLRACTWFGPPGRKIYQNGALSVTEVDPISNRLYCQNLCLLGKLFIDNKSSFYDVEPFLFYVLSEVDEHGSHIRGYFSKEKLITSGGHNVVCLLVLPPFQRQGYGKFLVGFSYELTKIQGVVGSPKKPLSALGMITYKSYWCFAILDILKKYKGTMSISSMSKFTGMTETDVLSTLRSLKLLKYWSRPDSIFVTFEVLERHFLSGEVKKPRLMAEHSSVNWKPV